MKYYFVLGLFIVCIFSGCTTKHYFQHEGKSASFFYRNAEASEVLFASSLDSFTYHPAERIKKNLWKVTVPAGKGFSYFYRVDGITILPDCRYTESDDFGARNCLFMD